MKFWVTASLLLITVASHATSADPQEQRYKSAQYENERLSDGNRLRIAGLGQTTTVGSATNFRMGLLSIKSMHPRYSNTFYHDIYVFFADGAEKVVAAFAAAANECEDGLIRIRSSTSEYTFYSVECEWGGNPGSRQFFLYKQQTHYVYHRRSRFVYPLSGVFGRELDSPSFSCRADVCTYRGRYSDSSGGIKGVLVQLKLTKHEFLSLIPDDEEACPQPEKAVAIALD